MQFLTEYVSHSDKPNRSAKIYDNGDGSYHIQMYSEGNMIFETKVNRSIHFLQDMASNYVNGIGAYENKQFLSEYLSQEKEQEQLNG